VYVTKNYTSSTFGQNEVRFGKPEDYQPIITPSPSEFPENSMSSGSVIAISIVSSVVVVAIIGVLVYFFIFRNRNKMNDEYEAKDDIAV
jgi:hypothetical protein